jgi:hypothetical protein
VHYPKLHAAPCHLIEGLEYRAETPSVPNMHVLQVGGSYPNMPAGIQYFVLNDRVV